MRQLNYRWIAVIAGLFVLSCILVLARWTPTTGQPAFVSPRPANTPEPEMLGFLEKRFQKFKTPLNFVDSVGVVAVPIKSMISMSDLVAKGAGTVGAIYVSTGSARLRLKPGAYTIDIVRVEARWFADLKDDGGAVQSRIPARVILGPEIKHPIFPSVEQSICFEINGGIVCI